MAKKVVRSKAELISAVKKFEQERRALVSRKCKNCKRRSFYKSFPATENFPQAAEYCGCKLCYELVDPNGCCEAFA